MINSDSKSNIIRILIGKWLKSKTSLNLEASIDENPNDFR